MGKREKLLLAIVNNVHYLQSLHESQTEKMRVMQERLNQVQGDNDDLRRKCAALTEERNLLRDYKNQYEKAMTDMNTMLIASQANAEEINRLYAEAEVKTDETEKLKLEVTVVATEKLAQKKELDRVHALYDKLLRDHSQHRIKYDLLVDDLTKANKSNSDYRSLIMDNQAKLNAVQQEIMELQERVTMEKKRTEAAQNETLTYKKQVESLFEELKANSDSESYDDEN